METNGVKTNGVNGNGGRAYLEAIALWSLLIWMVFMSAIVVTNINRTLDMVSVNMDLMTKAMIQISQEIKKQ